MVAQKKHHNSTNLKVTKSLDIISVVVVLLLHPHHYHHH